MADRADARADPASEPAAPGVVAVREGGAVKLIIMACSATKKVDQTEIPAINRYDGPMWRTLRAQLQRNPEVAAATKSGELLIWVVSARYGFFDAINTRIHDYDQKMTPRRMATMLSCPSYDLQRIRSFVDEADAVLFAGGELYRNAMWKASGGRLTTIMKIDETDGAGIGQHRAQLGAWLLAQFPAPEALAA